MEMKYEIAPDYTIKGLEFTGLTGSEHVFSVKESLIYLTLKNPANMTARAWKSDKPPR